MSFPMVTKSSDPHNMTIQKWVKTCCEPSELISCEFKKAGRSKTALAKGNTDELSDEAEEVAAEVEEEEESNLDSIRV